MPSTGDTENRYWLVYDKNDNIVNKALRKNGNDDYNEYSPNMGLVTAMALSRNK